jgi:flagellar basal body-associated protein FliL
MPNIIIIIIIIIKSPFRKTTGPDLHAQTPNYVIHRESVTIIIIVIIIVIIVIIIIIMISCFVGWRTSKYDSSASSTRRVASAVAPWET